MITIKEEKCIGCGLCINDCVANDLELVSSKAIAKNVTCIKCGHCIAVCPSEAIAIDDYSMEDVKEYKKETFAIEPERILNFIKFRRSIRQFKHQAIEDDKIKRIIEAGRFTATGSNQQNTSYIVVRDEIAALRNLTLKRLSESTKVAATSSSASLAMKFFAEKWATMYQLDQEEAGKGDKLFYDAGAVILIVSPSPVDAALAAANMELMAVAEGLGGFYCGFFIRTAQGNTEIKALCGLKEHQEITVCLVLGYPDIAYQRTVPRKPATIIWR